METLNSCADIVYRANLANGRPVALRLTMSPALATPADAWSRLASAYGSVDPRTLEIEIRH